VAKLWGDEQQLIEERDTHAFEQRGINAGHDVLQVLAITFEP
jgi:hypothetical protein